MRKLLLLCCGMLVLALPASATMPVPTLRTEAVFFHCNGSTKVANANYLADGNLPGWNTSQPTQSVQQGGGCGWADSFTHRSTQAGNSVHDGAWAGTFTGNLETLTVDLHSISFGPGRAGGEQTFNVTLFVEGKSMFGVAEDGRANRAAVRLTPVVSSTQASALYRFSITDLPFKIEDGNGTKTRDVVLNVAAASEPMMAWVYDTTEVPSGIVFNPESLAAVRVPAAP